MGAIHYTTVYGMDRLQQLPLRIGLTGGIASGKTTVSDLFAQYQVPIIDADVLAHQLVQRGQPALQQISAHFGASILLDDGALNRAKLRELVFTDAAQRQALEQILHPLIRHSMQQQIAALSATPYCILSVPLLLETQQTDLVDRVLVIDCPEALQHSRLAARNGFDTMEIERILAAQTDRASRLAAAHDVIHNEQDQTYLAQQVTTLHQYYLKLAATHLPKRTLS